MIPAEFVDFVNNLEKRLINLEDKVGKVTLTLENLAILEEDKLLWTTEAIKNANNQVELNKSREQPYESLKVVPLSETSVNVVSEYTHLTDLGFDGEGG